MSIDPELDIHLEHEARMMKWDSEPPENDAPQFCHGCGVEMEDEDLKVDDLECTKCIDNDWMYRREQGRGSPGNVGQK